ncbi:hypothetical protein Q5752_004774 [Cryptotrichosporon argae]
MPPSSAYIQHVYDVLAQREAQRQEYSRLMPTRQASPEQLFYSVSRSIKHKVANRYSNIFAYDRTAVLVDGEGYLNANVVRDTRGRWWVAAQAPLPETFHAFFRAMLTGAASRHPAVAERATKKGAVILVQLTGWEEKGVPKADPYFPAAGQEASHAAPGGHIATSNQAGAGLVHVRADSTEHKPHLGSLYTRGRVWAEAEADGVDLHHYYYADWPDHGVPEGEAVDKLRALVLAVGAHQDELECEVWVHCSAGVGRTGTFIALSSVLLPPRTPGALPDSPLGALPDNLQSDQVATTIDGIREWRGWLVQQQAQAELSIR